MKKEETPSKQQPVLPMDNNSFVETVATLTKETLKTGYIPKEALGFPDAKIESLYSQAYRLYNAGKYQDALNIFRLLAVLDAKKTKHSLGMAACLHMMKEYPQAVELYTYVGLIDANDPIPYYHSSDCYLKMNNKAAAIYCLEMAVKRAGKRSEFQTLKDRALLTIASLNKEIRELAEKTKGRAYDNKST